VKTHHYFKHHVLSPGWASTLLLCLIFGLTGVAQEKPKNSEAISEKQKGAEAAADQVLTRFYETLDFAVIYRELYVSEPLKHQEVKIIIGNILRQGTRDLTIPQIDFAAMERAYIAKRNFDFLVSAENFTDDGDRESLRKEMEVEFERYYMPMMSPENWPILTAGQLDAHFTANLNQLGQVLRKRVVKGTLERSLSQRLAALKRAELGGRSQRLFPPAVISM
jgi:hypothetical protein